MERSDYSGHAVRRPWYKHTHTYTHSYKVRAYILTVTLTTVVSESFFLSFSLESDSDPDAVARDLEVGKSVYLWFHLTALCTLAFTLLNYSAALKLYQSYQGT